MAGALMAHSFNRRGVLDFPLNRGAQITGGPDGASAYVAQSAIGDREAATRGESQRWPDTAAIARHVRRSIDGGASGTEDAAGGGRIYQICMSGRKQSAQ